MCNIRLKIAIIESGQKGYEIANSLNWHPTKVSQIVIGASRPSAEEKLLLANVLEKSVAELFNGNQETSHA
jgi:transcriptional regulator with XRE-family HTH domain